jgi:beta-lactamase regulating signal transducer with metallopeptidase domain
MLTLSFVSLSEAELKKVVADHCSAFGCPTTVKVLPPEEHREYGIALVEMSSSGEANDLATKFGDSQYGSRLVVIKLYHGEKATSKELTGVLRSPICDANPTHSSPQG